MGEVWVGRILPSSLRPLAEFIPLWLQEGGFLAGGHPQLPETAHSFFLLCGLLPSPTTHFSRVSARKKDFIHIVI